jgi:uncharacterized protein YdeI (YjbR/CyaY-like superfamily)
MDTLIGRVWSLDPISSAKIAEAKRNGRIIKEYISNAIQDAIKDGLKDEPMHRRDGVTQYIKLDSGLFYQMQAKAAKAGLTDTEYVRRAIRQHGANT